VGEETHSMLGNVWVGGERSEVTHQVVQHPHEGLELGLAHPPLELVVDGDAPGGHALRPRLQPIAVQHHQVGHAPRAPQRSDLEMEMRSNENALQT